MEIPWAVDHEMEDSVGKTPSDWLQGPPPGVTVTDGALTNISPVRHPQIFVKNPSVTVAGSGNLPNRTGTYFRRTRQEPHKHTFVPSLVQPQGGKSWHPPTLTIGQLRTKIMNTQSKKNIEF